MNYYENRVKGFVTPLIKKQRNLDNQPGSNDRPQGLVLPDTCFMLVFTIWNGLTLTSCRQRGLLRPGVHFGGKLISTVRQDTPTYTKAVMLELYPWAPDCFTNADLQFFTNRIIGIRSDEPSPMRPTC